MFEVTSCVIFGLLDYSIGFRRIAIGWLFLFLPDPDLIAVMGRLN
jgi:hypothetical protein